MPKYLKNSIYLSVTITKEQYEWLEARVKEGKFASISHGIRVSIKNAMGGD